MREDAIELRSVEIQGGFGPDDVIGFSHFLFGRPLGVETLLDMLWWPTAGQQTLALGGGGTGDTNGCVELALGVGFEKKRDDDDGERVALGAPSFNLGTPESTNAWVE